MAGNSKRPGARRQTNKKGPTVGSGGNGRRALEGRGPTPKAEDRVYHVAHKRKAAAGKAKPAPRRNAGPRRTDEMIAGRNSVVEALRAGLPITTLYVGTRMESDERVREAIAAVAKAGLPILEVSKQELDRLTDDANHQGLAAAVPPYAYAHPDDLVANAGPVPLIVALDGVQDPRNLGAILRSAAAFGADGLLVPERRAAGMTAAAWKVSAGAAARIPVARATNLARTLADYKSQGLFVVGLAAGTPMTVADLELATAPLVVVIGSEGKGLSRLIRETCDVVASIPIASTTESLNASVAAAIALYEVDRLRARG